MHWYVYHSQRAMGHAYSELGAPTAFSTKSQPKLCHGDVVWVIEGDTDNPTKYAIVDCFKVQDTEWPPFSAPYSDFKLKVNGERSLLGAAVPLNGSAPWFAKLHGGFITKQRFFCNLTDHPDIQDGLTEASRFAIQSS